MAAPRSTIRRLIYWEYAKLISGSAVGNRADYGFVSVTYHRLIHGRMNASSILTENKRLCEAGDVCAYCGSTEPLHWEHIVPLAAKGPDSIDNMVRACRACNLSKAARDPYQWYAARNQIDEIPRLVLGKLLKVVFAEYERRGLLDDETFMKARQLRRITLCSVFALEEA